MLRTKRKPHAIELLCEHCGQPFAELYPDRLLLFSFHYGRNHTSAFGAEQMESVYDAALRGEVSKPRCSCGKQPCAVVQLGGMMIQSKHKIQGVGSQPHSNTLGLEDLERICRYINSSCDTLRVVDAFDVTPLREVI